MLNELVKDTDLGAYSVYKRTSADHTVLHSPKRGLVVSMVAVSRHSEDL